MSYRMKLSANQHWRFYRGAAPVQKQTAGAASRHLDVWDVDYDDSGWETVTLPHTVREEALMCSGGRNYQGESWYRLHFAVPDQCAGLSMYFELEAAMHRVDAWLDGNPLGVRFGGFLPMAFDFTGLNAAKEHVLVLKVDNSDMLDVPPGKPQGTLDFCYFGGIYRDAWLHAMHPVHFTSAVHANKTASGGLFVHYGQVTEHHAEISVDSHFENCSAESSRVVLELVLNDEVVYTSSQITLPPSSDHVEKASFKVKEPKLWHPYHPNLYTLKARLMSDENVIDEITERIGIRTFEFTPEGFFINGEKLFLSGANRHQEYPYVGFALPDSVQRRDVRMLRKSGVISIRLGHYPQDQAFMDACDEMGILCVIPTPGWQIHPSSVLFDERSYENTRRLIRMNRNHPSACLWEPVLNETDYPEYFAKKQLEIVKEEMGPDRAWCACDSHFAYAQHYPVIYSHDHIDGRPRYIREYGDNWTEQFGPMTTLRRVRRGENVSFYSGGEAAMLRSAQEHFEHYAMIRLDDTLSGGAMWAGIDHNRGYEDNEAAVGMLDLQRLPKYYYHIFDVQQSIENAGPKCFIANEWTETSVRDVHVYTNAPAARLFVNGKLIGTLSAEEGWANAHVYTRKLEGVKLPETVHPPIIFKNVSWEKGSLRAEALLDGDAVAAYEVHTPETPVRISLQAQWMDENIWLADGSDLLLVHAYIQDSHGTTVKSAEPLIHFSVSGDAEIVGEGYDWTKANPMRAEAGVASVLLRAGCKADQITLEAESEGLRTGKIILKTSEATVPRLLCHTKKEKKARPVYPLDANERFSVPQSLQQEPRLDYDMGCGKPAFASSCAAGTYPENINRGKIEKPWIAADTFSPQWWKVDLEEVIWVTGVTIKWYNDGLWYDYSVEVSANGTEWSYAAEGHASGQSHLPIRFSQNLQARYVRINILSVTGNQPAGMYFVGIHGEKQKI